MKKTWCRHIEWLPKLFGLRYWKNYWYCLNPSVEVPRSWKVCPICGDERPTKANIAAAVNRALQDAGDEE